MLSPYNFTNPVTDANMFFGRAAETAEILEGLREGRSFAVIGGKRSGKTSLLYALKRALLEELEREGSYPVGPVFLSTHELPRLSPSVIYQKIAQTFRQDICAKKPNWDVDMSALLDPGLNDEKAKDAFEGFLASLLRQVSPRLRLVILLDEVDALKGHGWSPQFFSNWRHLISQGRLRDNVAIVIAGTVAAYELYKVAGSPFSNVLKATKTLKVLDRAEAGDLIQKPCESRVPPAVAEEVLRQSGGHPFLVQFLMDQIVRRTASGVENARVEDVAWAVDKFFEGRQDFEGWSETISDADWKVYDRVADASGPVTKAQVIEWLRDPKDANRALDLLTHLGVLREERRNTYAFGGEMFRMWRRENFAAPAPPENIVEEVRPPSRRTREEVVVVLASAGDVSDEREAAEKVVDELNRDAARERGYIIVLARWETDAYPGFHAEGPQGKVFEGLRIEECDAVVGIFWKRFGSGTQKEIQKAIRLWDEKKVPQIMLYFRPGSPEGAKAAKEYAKLQGFKEGMGKRALYWNYGDVREFADKLRQHLTKFLGERVRAKRAVVQGWCDGG